MTGAEVGERWRDGWPVVRPLLVITGIAAWLTGVVQVVCSPGPIALDDTELMVAIVVAVALLAVVGICVAIARRDVTRSVRLLVLPRVVGLLVLPVTGIIVVLALCVGDVLSWVVALIAVGFFGLWPVACEFSRFTLRVVTTVFVVGALLVLLAVGDDALVEQRASEQREVATKLADDLKGLDDADATALAAAEKAVDDLCSTAGGVVADPSGGSSGAECFAANDRAPKGASAVRRAAVDAEDQVSALVLAAKEAKLEAATGDAAEAEAKAAVDAATKRRESAVAEAAAESEAAPGDPPEASVIDIVRAGAEAAFDAVPGIDTSSTTVVLQFAGWALLGVLALLWYRQLEIRAIERGVGPVAIEPGDTMTDQHADFTRFSTDVARNVPEPGLAPGSTTAVSVTDVIEAAPAPEKMLQKALAAVLAVVRPTARYRVVVDQLEPDGDGEHRVFVRIFDARTGESLHRVDERAVDKSIARRTAAYATAAWILSRSDVVPGWAEWKLESSRAFAEFERSHKTPEDIERLLEYQREAPRSGLLSVQAVEAIITTDPTHALALSLRTSILYPRYLTARYNVVVALVLVASNQQKYWWDRPAGERAAIGSLLEVQAARLGLDRSELPNLQAPPADRRRSESVGADTLDEWSRRAYVHAVDHLDLLDDACSLLAVYVNALRRHERAYWWPLQRDRKRRTTQAVVETARGALAARAHLPAGRFDAAHEARRRQGSAWSLYNLACWRLVLEAESPAARRQALEILERARDAPDGTQLEASWLRSDPDLAPLLGDPRFDALLATLKGETKDVVDTKDDKAKDAADG